jgi:transcriptional regulator with XRE-family HTH domain
MRRGVAAKVDQRMIHRIKELRNQQKTQEEIAVEVGISQGRVSFVLRMQGLGGWLATQGKMA